MGHFLLGATPFTLVAARGRLPHCGLWISDPRGMGGGHCGVENSELNRLMGPSSGPPRV